MDLDLAQLRALDATVREGTLEAAARALHLPPSAVSQRLRALEVATGRVLLVRTKPVRVTESGEVVLRLGRQVGPFTADAARERGAGGVLPRLARQVGLLPADAARELGGEGHRPSLPIAVNADSMDTWVLPALAPLAADHAFDPHREDQEHTTALLRAGAVMAAITAEAEPVPGCTVTPLGRMRYRPMAAPAFAARWFPDGPTPEALRVAPVVGFDRQDALQHTSRRRRVGPDADPRPHYVPATADYLAAIVLGFGWGMVLDLQRPAAGGGLLDLDPGGVVALRLHWQQWKLRSPSLDRVREAIQAAARTQLDQADSGA